MAARLIRAATAALLGLALGACTQAAQVRADLERGATQGAQIRGVPFVPQRPDTCGAAALAAVLRHMQIDAAEPALAEALRTRQAHGAVTYELAMEARRQGAFATQRYDVTADELRAAIDAGVAPIVLRGGLAHAYLGVYHYTVLTAYDLDRRVWIAHDGDAADVLIDFESLAEDRWRADRWALLVAAPSARPLGLGAKVHLEMGVQAEQIGDAAAAAHHYAQAAWTPASAQALLNLSNVASSRGELERAEHLLRAALQARPDAAASQNNLAWVLLKLGRDLDEGIALAKAAAQDPEVRPHALDTLAQLEAAVAARQADPPTP